MFINPTINCAGIYGVKFCINGELQTIIVDDYIPCYAGTLDPIFAAAKDGSYWVSILEKAWAKIHGSYERTIGGHLSSAYSILTGCPVYKFSIDYELEQVKHEPGDTNLMLA